MFWDGVHWLSFLRRSLCSCLVSQQEGMDRKSMVLLLRIHCPDVKPMEILLCQKLGFGSFFNFHYYPMILEVGKKLLCFHSCLLPCLLSLSQCWGQRRKLGHANQFLWPKQDTCLHDAQQGNGYSSPWKILWFSSMVGMPWDHSWVSQSVFLFPFCFGFNCSACSFHIFSLFILSWFQLWKAFKWFLARNPWVH